MSKQSLAAVMVVVWCAVVSATVARAHSIPVGKAGRPPERPSASELLTPARMTDAPTGLVLSTTVHSSGVTVFRAVGRGLEVEKTLAPDGAFHLSVRSPGDVVQLAGTPSRITVARQGRSITLLTRQSDDKAFQKAAVLLAGSPAIRLFRAALSRMAATNLESDPGVALQLADALLRVVQDDAPAAVAHVRRQVGQGPLRSAAGVRPARLDPGPLPGLADGSGESCFRAWRNEVMSAWLDYEGCYYDFSWWSGGREVCAFLYIIEVESAWFKMLSCSAIKIV